MRNDPDCQYCGEVETMEQMNYGCEKFGKKQWLDLSRYLTTLTRIKYNSQLPIFITFKINYFQLGGTECSASNKRPKSKEFSPNINK